MNTLNKINLNNTQYIRPTAVSFKGQPVETNSLISFSNEQTEALNNTVIKDPSPEKVTFLGFISNTINNLLEKTYENSTSDLVLASIEQDDVKSSLNLIG